MATKKASSANTKTELTSAQAFIIKRDGPVSGCNGAFPMLFISEEMAVKWRECVTGNLTVTYGFCGVKSSWDTSGKIEVYSGCNWERHVQKLKVVKLTKRVAATMRYPVVETEPGRSQIDLDAAKAIVKFMFPYLWDGYEHCRSGERWSSSVWLEALTERTAGLYNGAYKGRSGWPRLPYRVGLLKDQGFSGKEIPAYFMEGTCKDVVVEIPDGVERIGEWAFFKGRFKNVVLPATVKEVGKYAFADSEGDIFVRGWNIELPEGIVSVGAHAFFHPGAHKRKYRPDALRTRNLKLPSSLKSLGAWALHFLDYSDERIAAITDWSSFNADDWAYIIANWPKFAEKCDNWDEFSSEAWGWLLASQPQFASRCNKWSEFDSEVWSLVLSKQPQFEDKCDKWESFTELQFLNLLEAQPQFADKCGSCWGKFSGNNWSFLLRAQPRFSNLCDQWNGWREFEDSQWEMLLSSQPQFIDKCRSLTSLKGPTVCAIIKAQPQMADKFSIEKLGDKASKYWTRITKDAFAKCWDALIEAQPQFAKYRK